MVLLLSASESGSLRSVSEPLLDENPAGPPSLESLQQLPLSALDCVPPLGCQLLDSLQAAELLSLSSSKSDSVKEEVELLCEVDASIFTRFGGRVSFSIGTLAVGGLALQELNSVLCVAHIMILFCYGVSTNINIYT